jgi:hypothetical protein
MPFLDQLFKETVCKIQDFRGSGRALPPWLQRQALGMVEAESNWDRGMKTFMDGLQQESEVYKELDNG